MKLRLTYPHEHVNEPILSLAVKEVGVLLNILEATVNSEKGEIIVSVEAPDERLNRLVDFLQGRGVHVERLTQVLQVDKERCTSCGACISPCPVEAIRFQPDWSVEFIEEKCVGCGICAIACPVRAVKLL